MKVFTLLQIFIGLISVCHGDSLTYVTFMGKGSKDGDIMSVRGRNTGCPSQWTSINSWNNPINNQTTEVDKSMRYRLGMELPPCTLEWKLHRSTNENSALEPSHGGHRIVSFSPNTYTFIFADWGKDQIDVKINEAVRVRFIGVIKQNNGHSMSVCGKFDDPINSGWLGWSCQWGKSSIITANKVVIDLIFPAPDKNFLWKWVWISVNGKQKSYEFHANSEPRRTNLKEFRCQPDEILQIKSTINVIKIEKLCVSRTTPSPPSTTSTPTTIPTTTTATTTTSPSTTPTTPTTTQKTPTVTPTTTPTTTPTALAKTAPTMATNMWSRGSLAYVTFMGSGSKVGDTMSVRGRSTGCTSPWISINSWDHPINNQTTEVDRSMRYRLGMELSPCNLEWKLHRSSKENGAARLEPLHASGYRQTSLDPDKYTFLLADWGKHHIGVESYEAVRVRFIGVIKQNNGHSMSVCGKFDNRLSGWLGWSCQWGKSSIITANKVVIDLILPAPDKKFLWKWGWIGVDGKQKSYEFHANLEPRRTSLKELRCQPDEILQIKSTINVTKIEKSCVSRTTPSPPPTRTAFPTTTPTTPTTPPLTPTITANPATIQATASSSTTMRSSSVANSVSTKDSGTSQQINILKLTTCTCSDTTTTAATTTTTKPAPTIDPRFVALCANIANERKGKTIPELDRVFFNHCSTYGY